MSEQLLTPKFLTHLVAQQGVQIAFRAILNKESFVSLTLKRHTCHVVVLVPGMTDARDADYPDWPDYPIKPVCIFETSYGDRSTWEHKYDAIAKCEALQLWTNRNDGRTSSIPHLLFQGDTPHWGGVKRDGIVVACAGVQSYFGKLISGIAADTMIALAHYDYEQDAAVLRNAAFLT